MAQVVLLRFSILVAVGLGAVVFPCSLSNSPAFGQTDVIGIINGIIQRQQELAERRRQESAAYRRMQYGLSQLGFYEGPIDGDFGPQTAEALTAYRRSIGRPNSEPPSYKEIAEIESRASEQIPGSPPPEPPSAPKKSKLLRADTPPRIDAKLSDDAAWIVFGDRNDRVGFTWPNGRSPKKTPQPGRTNPPRQDHSRREHIPRKSESLSERPS